MNSQKKTELITVVIANHNRCDDLRAAIRSVKEQEYPNIEIVIVDNASCDGSRDMLADEFPGMCVITLDENRGMDGYSEGFRWAQGEFIFQMDNDSIMPDRNVLTEVVKRFCSGPPDLGVVATRVEESRNGRGDVAALRGKDKRRGPINTGGFHAGGVAFRRTYLNQVGYYNRDVFLYGSELFLEMKFLDAGYKVFYYPEILMLHKSSNVARSTNAVYYELRNRYWFFRHFATTAQQIRFLPPIVFHDLIYAFSKRAVTSFFKAVKEGFGPLPMSLQPPLRSQKADFIRKVNERGRSLNLLSLVRHMKSKYLITNT